MDEEEEEKEVREKELQEEEAVAEEVVKSEHPPVDLEKKKEAEDENPSDIIITPSLNDHKLLVN